MGQNTAALNGEVIMAPYNNETYKVEDIDWKQNPLSTFDCKGTATSYVDYYQKVCIEMLF